MVRLVVVRQAGTFHYRRVVPLPLRPILGRREVWLSLRTPYKRIAESRATRFNASVEEVFTMAGQKLGVLLAEDPCDELIVALEAFCERFPPLPMFRTAP
jgi:hypothetical protein